MQIINGERHPVVYSDAIYGFFQEYRYLSNFHICKVEINGTTFTSSEAAFMSFKSYDVEYQLALQTASPVLAKNLGRQVELRPDWDKVRIPAMFTVLYSKFVLNMDIRDKLISTGNKILVETNDWGDEFWGQSYITGKGKNMLGQLLMAVRDIIKVEGF